MCPFRFWINDSKKWSTSFWRLHEPDEPFKKLWSWLFPACVTLVKASLRVGDVSGRPSCLCPCLSSFALSSHAWILSSNCNLDTQGAQHTVYKVMILTFWKALQLLSHPSVGRTFQKVKIVTFESMRHLSNWVIFQFFLLRCPMLVPLSPFASFDTLLDWAHVLKSKNNDFWKHTPACLEG